MSLHQKVNDVVNNFLGLFQIKWFFYNKNIILFGQVNILKIRINK